MLGVANNQKNWCTLKPLSPPTFQLLIIYHVIFVYSTNRPVEYLKENNLHDFSLKICQLYRNKTSKMQEHVVILKWRIVESYMYI
jgi:hypothetical protein